MLSGVAKGNMTMRTPLEEAAEIVNAIAGDIGRLDAGGCADP